MQIANCSMKCTYVVVAVDIVVVVVVPCASANSGPTIGPT